MNSDREDNSDFGYRQILDWLKQQSTADPSDSEPSEKSQTSDFSQPPEQRDGSQDRLDAMLETTYLEPIEVNDEFPYYLEDPLDWEEDEEIVSQFGGSAQRTQPLNMGDIPTVRKRFQALLKRRLQVEIERHPPRFPWEMDVPDTLPQYTDDTSERTVPARQFWMPQLLTLLPVELPERVLSVLFESCTEVLNAFGPPEAKTVKAVSRLFPDRLPLLDDMAGRIRLSLAPSRLPALEQERQRQELAASLPRDYDSATCEQQIALSLLAAREIMDKLTLTLSPQEPIAELQWQTELGLLQVRADFAENNRSTGTKALRISARLPKGGSLSVETNQESARAERTYPGQLSVELFDWQPGQIYSATIHLTGCDRQPLSFAIICR